MRSSQIESEGEGDASDPYKLTEEQQTSPGSLRKEKEKKKGEKRAPAGAPSPNAPDPRQKKLAWAKDTPSLLAMKKGERQNRGKNIDDFIDEERERTSGEPQKSTRALSGLFKTDDSDAAIVHAVEEEAEAEEKRASAKSAKKRTKSKGPRSVDPAVLRSVYFFWFRKAAEGEDAKFVYCLGADCEGEPCNNGRVAISDERGGLRLRSENCKSHVQRCHKAWSDEVEAAGRAGKDAKQTFDAILASKTPRLKQSKLMSVVRRIDEKEGKVLMEFTMMCHMIHCNIPFATLDSPTWASVQKRANVSMASRNTMTKLIEPMYLAALTITERKIRNARCFSIGIDYWTSASKDKYLAITYHFTNRDTMTVESVLLDLVPCNASATAETTRQLIESRLFRHFEGCSGHIKKRRNP